MSSLKRFDDFINEKKWIKGAIEHPGALRRHFHKKEGEKITKTEIKDEISDLIKKDIDKKKPGAQLGKRDATLYKRLQLAKTLRGMNENHEEMENYMFFANISNMKRMCEDILEMDPNKIDDILKDGHGWATDHIATSKDDVEEVYGFLKSTMDLHHNDDEDMLSDGENC
jgi:hypothetical protein